MFLVSVNYHDCSALFSSPQPLWDHGLVGVGGLREWGGRGPHAMGGHLALAKRCVALVEGPTREHDTPTHERDIPLHKHDMFTVLCAGDRDPSLWPISRKSTDQHGATHWVLGTPVLHYLDQWFSTLCPQMFFDKSFQKLHC